MSSKLSKQNDTVPPLSNKTAEATAKGKNELASIKEKIKMAQTREPPMDVTFQEVTPEKVDKLLALYPVGMRTGLTTGEIPKVQRLAASGVPLKKLASDLRVTVSVLKKFL